MSLSRKQLLALMLGLVMGPAFASADTITFTSANSVDSAWYWAGPGQPLWGSILAGTATQGSTGNTVDISCGPDCWVSWGTGNSTASTPTSLTFQSAGSFIWVYGNDGNGNVTLLLNGSFTDTAFSVNADGSYTLTSNFTGTLSPVLLALLGIPGSGPIDVSGTFTGILLGSFDPNTGGFGWYDPNDPSSWGTGILQVTVADDLQAPVPEPGTLALFGTGLLGVAAMVRRKLTA